MKLLQINILLIFLPFLLLSQTTKKFEIADSILNVRELLLLEFGPEINEQIQELDSMQSPYFLGLLELENMLDKSEKSKNPGGCQCHTVSGKIEIANAIGFMSGIASVIELNLKDSTYHSNIWYHTDGIKSHKFKADDDFIVDIKVDLEISQLFISPDSEFKHNGTIKGRLVGTSIKYYEKSRSPKGYEAVQLNVLSVFECKLQDYNHMLIEAQKKATEQKIKEANRDKN